MLDLSDSLELVCGPRTGHFHRAVGGFEIMIEWSSHLVSDCESMSGENRQLVTNEPVEFEK